MIEKENYKILEVDKRIYKLSLYDKYISLSLCKRTKEGFKNIGKIFIIVRFEDNKVGRMIFDNILNDAAKIKYLIKSNQIYNQEL